MAYAYDITKPTVRNDGTATWEISETDVQTDSQWVISGLPKECRITLFASHLITPGAASTIQPALGNMSGWTIDGEGSVSKADAAATDHVINTTVKAFLPDGKLYGKTTPDVNGATLVRTRISIRPGHE